MTITWNQRPVGPVAFIDFETWAPIPLKSRQRYIDASTVLCSALRINGETLVNPSRETLAQVSSTHTLVAHNAVFDAAVWEHLDLPPATFCDTLPMARAVGLPGKLDKLGVHLGIGGKTKQGKQVLDLFIKSKVLPPAHLPIYPLLYDYCARDVELLEVIYRCVHGHGEVDVMEVDRNINQRGLPIDREYMERVREVMTHNRKLADDRLADQFNPRSPKQVKEWLSARGYNVESVTAKVLADLTFDEDTAEYIEDKREATRTGLNKIETALECLDDDNRLRDMYAYCAQLPGRWSSYGLQIHNLPKSQEIDVRHVEPTVVAVKQAALERNCRTSDVTNGMIRHCIRHPDLMVADFSAIEPRMLSWLCRNDEMMRVWGDPRKNAYLEMGKKVFGRTITKADIDQYWVSKQLVIGCGYGMGGHKFAMTLDYYKVKAPDGLTPADLVKAFRKASPQMTALWSTTEKAVLHIVRTGGEQRVDRIHYYLDGNTLVIRLPSGRCLYCHNARIESIVPIYCYLHHMPLIPQDVVVYDHPMFGRREFYGSKIIENITTASCRDILAWVLVQLDTASFEPCLHAHDEVGCLRGDFHDFMRIMSTPPPWCEDFPLVVEGYKGPFWAKKSSGWLEAKYQNGNPI